MTVSKAYGCSTDNLKTIIFLHIPKAAGTTLNHIIRDQCGEAQVFGIDGAHIRHSLEELEAMSTESKKRLHYVTGHQPFGIHEYFACPSTYITLLRHPVDRVISHYYYVLRTPGHRLYPWVTSPGMSIADYVRAGLTSELHNGQTRLLAGDDVVVREQLLRDFRTLDEYRTAVSELMDDSPPSEVMLDAAKRNLQEHFSVVGLTERFDESVILMKRRLGWDAVRYTPRNVTSDRPSRSEVPVTTVRVIEKRNQKDLELYAFARRLFEQDVANERIGFKLDVAAFRLLNRAHHVSRRSRGLAGRGYRWLRRRSIW